MNIRLINSKVSGMDDPGVKKAHAVREEVEKIIDGFVKTDNTDLDSNEEKGIIDAKGIKTKIENLKDVSGIYIEEEQSLKAKGISEEDDREVRIEYFEKEDSLTGGTKKSYRLGDTQAMFNDKNKYADITLTTYSDGDNYEVTG